MDWSSQKERIILFADIRRVATARWQEEQSWDSISDPRCAEKGSQVEEVSSFVIREPF